jgi:DNA repair exonuclease SbcCD nuclease subunit
MTKLFNKVAMCTDLHFGGKNNSAEFNEDIIQFLTWFVESAHENNCETCIILGDWHDSRSSINVLTLNYSIAALRLLSKSFKQTYILTGNHDLFYREKREIHSLPMGNEIDNITIVDEPLDLGDCLLLPWLINEEWKSIVKSKAKYIFSHLELPGFKMNAMIDMPDHGGINGKHFVNQDYVFTGHFHKRQYKDNIHYIGSPFGHNYGEAGDFEHGACFLQWGGKPQYVNYDGPKYFDIPLSSLLSAPEHFATPNAYLKVQVDIDLSYEEALCIRDTFSTEYKVREFKLIPKKAEYSGDESSPLPEKSTVDGMIASSLETLDTNDYDINLLMRIYEKL